MHVVLEVQVVKLVVIVALVNGVHPEAPVVCVQPKERAPPNPIHLLQFLLFNVKLSPKKALDVAGTPVQTIIVGSTEAKYFMSIERSTANLFFRTV